MAASFPELVEPIQAPLFQKANRLKMFPAKWIINNPLPHNAGTDSGPEYWLIDAKKRFVFGQIETKDYAYDMNLLTHRRDADNPLTTIRCPSSITEPEAIADWNAVNLPRTNLTKEAFEALDSTERAVLFHTYFMNGERDEHGNPAPHAANAFEGFHWVMCEDRFWFGSTVSPFDEEFDYFVSILRERPLDVLNAKLQRNEFYKRGRDLPFPRSNAEEKALFNLYWRKYKVDELRRELAKVPLDAAGPKADLINRLIAYHDEHGGLLGKPDSKLVGATTQPGPALDFGGPAQTGGHVILPLPTAPIEQPSGSHGGARHQIPDIDARANTNRSGSKPVPREDGFVDGATKVKAKPVGKVAQSSAQKRITPSLISKDTPNLTAESARPEDAPQNGDLSDPEDIINAANEITDALHLDNPLIRPDVLSTARFDQPPLDDIESFDQTLFDDIEAEAEQDLDSFADKP